MLPSAWHTPRLSVRDATAADLGLCHACLADSQDAAPLDPAFKLVPPAEIQEHITRSTGEAALPSRAFQMQVLRLTSSEDAVGYWHFMAVPKRPEAIGVSIMLIRPAYRRHGLGRELVEGALARFEPSKTELWARVYLGNPRAIEFWAGLGLARLVRLHDTYVSTPAEQPSIILSRCLPDRDGSCRDRNA